MKKQYQTESRRKTVALSELYPIIDEILQNGGQFQITVTGNSMSPFLYEYRDMAVLAPLPARKIRKGDIVFYQRQNGQYVMHRVYAVDERGVMTLLGDAQWTLEPGIRPEQLRAFVPRVVRKGREISCERGLWHRLMTAYQLRIRHPGAARLAMRLLRLPLAVRRRLLRLMGNAE